MNRTWIGVVVLALLVGGVLLAKSMRSQLGPAVTGGAVASTSQTRPQVILFADPKEAEVLGQNPFQIT